jgi:hypothetical protein
MKLNLLLLSAVAMLVNAAAAISLAVDADIPTLETETETIEAIDAVNLGSLCNYVILAQSGISTVPASVITGNIAVSPIAATAMTGFGLTLHSGGMYSTATQVVGGGKAYAASYGGATATALTVAVGDMGIAYADAAGRANNDAGRINVGQGAIGGLTLTPGVYTFGMGISIGTGTQVTFDAKNNADAVFILQSTGVLWQAADTRVILANGAQAKNIFWQVAGNVAISARAHMEGIILCKTDVVFETGSSLNGSVYAQTAVNLQMATITQASTCAGVKQVCADGDIISKESLTIGTFPTLLSFGPPGTPPISTTATADYYFCAKNGKATNNAPLVIIIPGADAGKTEYSMAAKAFVKRGYTAAVLEEPIDIGEGQTLYLASARSLKLFIDIVTANEDFPASTDHIMLAGHSFGGSQVLYYLQGRCPAPICVPGVPGLSVFEPATSQIKAAGGFGTSVITRDPDDASLSWNVGLNNANFPFFIVNGEFDEKNTATIEGEPVMDGTLDRLTPFNGLATIDDLDHYSIVDDLVFPGADTNNNGNSMESREFQVNAAVSALDRWFDTSIQGTFADTCADLVEDAVTAGYTLSRCEVNTE